MVPTTCCYLHMHMFLKQKSDVHFWILALATASCSRKPRTKGISIPAKNRLRLGAWTGAALDLTTGTYRHRGFEKRCFKINSRVGKSASYGVLVICIDYLLFLSITKKRKETVLCLDGARRNALTTRGCEWMRLESRPSTYITSY